MKFICLIVLISVGIMGWSHGFPSGAPPSTCLSMYPGHYKRPQDRSTNPYVIKVDGDVMTYTSKDTVTVRITSPSGKLLVRGFLLEARTDTGSTAGPIGTFTNVEKKTKTICGDKALTQQIWVPQEEFVATWMAPKGFEDDMYFVATVLQSYDTFWMDVRSDVLTYLVPIPAPIPTIQALDVNDTCTEELLQPLPLERPHVAMLCSAHAQCPCGWLCCPSGNSGNITIAICRKPQESTENIDDYEIFASIYN